MKLILLGMFSCCLLLLVTLVVEDQLKALLDEDSMPVHGICLRHQMTLNNVQLCKVKTGNWKTLAILKNGNHFQLSKVTGKKIGNRVKPLCGSEELEGITTCGTNNSFPICLETPFGRITKCLESQKEVPLCYVIRNHRRLVVNCNDPTLVTCFSTDPRIPIKFCKKSSGNLCWGHSNKMRPCPGIRSKRQEPDEPQLDVDGYYMNCENCKLKIRMEVNNAEERPVIKISSEPMYEDGGASW